MSSEEERKRESINISKKEIGKDIQYSWLLQITTVSYSVKNKKRVRK
jgi:hypothetical protein